MENLITIYKADYYISQNITKQRITNRRTVGIFTPLRVDFIRKL